ncbi:uncharacterized protein AB675_1754 [Cyphellophora attinorum]|uniref:Monocarboxylate transporter 12 n=1 Tax=Cyphellophora attinorum TaxID=1664694 RepID=A0A0N0NPM9_9EURO|nr:uncharacterized protein AB675_1754 [Phialophora attinorum]KPI42908.1 hypothetical protein AB675_1754 [Phialophora attinorum]
MAARSQESVELQGAGAAVAPASSQETDNAAHAAGQDARQIETSGKRAATLIGQAVLQLPIWGFAMTYGVFQDYYTAHWTLSGSVSGTGVIGTTQNGVMYMSMPFLFALFSRRWARYRRTASLVGVVLTCASFLLSSYSTNVWHLILTQGVLAALGCALIYSPTTLTLGEWFSTNNRALAYGIILSSKNIVGSTCPFLIRHLLDVYGFRLTLRIWTAIVAGSALGAIYLIPSHPSSTSAQTYHARKLPWSHLHHRTFWIYAIATMLQSSGYGIPQTYINTYASNITHLPQTSSTLLLTFFNLPGIISSSFFGYLNNGKRFSLSASTVATISGVSSALSAFLLWGFASQHNTAMALLTLFSITFGFFAGGYSATWGGMINELEHEAAERNEAVDPGLLYGLLNGARGIGYVSGGLAGVPLLKAGAASSGMDGFAYGTAYGPLIVFTGLCSIFGGWSVVWKMGKLFH